MRDEKRWPLANARFQAYRKNIPHSIDDARLAEYHDLVSALEAATGEDLSTFCIPGSEMRPVVTGIQIGTRHSYGRKTYSEKLYCDDGYFKRQIEGLAAYLVSVEDQPVQTAGPSDYWLMSTTQLEALASKYQIGGYADQHGNVDREIIINALRRRDKAVSPEKRVSQHTINVTGDVHGSNFQLGTHGSTASVNYTVADQKATLAQLQEILPGLPLTAEDKRTVDADVATIEAQLNSGNPKKPILDLSWDSLKGVLEKVVASGVSVPVIHAISKLLGY